MAKLTDILAPLLLLVVFSLLFFTGLEKPVVIDYDEAVYAEVSRSMYERNEFIIPQLNGEDFFEKPPLLYWLQMLGYRLFSVSPLGARFFNGLCALATLTVFYLGARKPLGLRVAFNATLILGSSIIFVYLSRVAMTDMALMLFLTTSLIISWYGVERDRQGKDGAPLFWIGCGSAGLAMLAKGAIGALFPVATAVIYLLSIGRIAILFRPRWLLPGTAILLLVGLSWYLLLGFVHPQGFHFMKELFIEHHLGRFSAPMEGHSGPFYFYVIILLIGFMPWFSFLPIALIRLPSLTAKEEGGRFNRLFLIYSIVVFLFFSAAGTKLPNYILPALPGLALLVAHLFARREIRHPAAWRLSGYLSALLPALLGLVLAFAPLLFPYLGELLGEDARKAPVLAEQVDLGYAVWLAAGLFLLSSILIFRASRKPEAATLQERLLLCSFIHALALSLLILPTYDRLMNAPLTRLAREAAALSQPGQEILLFEIDDRPSVNFVTARPTRKVSERTIAQLAEIMKMEQPPLGITSVYYFNRLKNDGYPLTEIERDLGFILFRAAPLEPTGEQSPEAPGATVAPDP